MLTMYLAAGLCLVTVSDEAQQARRRGLEDFSQRIEAKLDVCDILVVVIGKQWLTTKDDAGGRRLDDPQDFVRLEIAVALKRNIPIFPVIVGGDGMPRSQDLPDELAMLTRHQALQVQYAGFRHSVQLLAEALSANASLRTSFDARNSRQIGIMPAS
jgi:hypothetical protein